MSKKKKQLIIIVILIAAVIAAAYFAVETLTSWRADHVRSITVRQHNTSLVAEWNSIKSSKYRVIISKDGKAKVREDIETNNYRLDDIECLHDYEVTVYGVNRSGDLVKGVSGTLYTKNPQDIVTEVDAAGGFAGETLELKASAEGDLSYSSADDKVATVDENGKITFVGNGSTTITITASESDEYLETVRDIETICYSEKLASPGLKISEEETELHFEITPSTGAQKYEITRKNKRTGKQELFRTVYIDEEGRSGVIHYTTERDFGTYRVRAVSESGDTRVASKPSEPVTVEGHLDEAPVYSAITNVMEIHGDDVDRVASAYGAGSATVAQSMCASEDGYIVAFVNRGNSVGRLEKYSKIDGELIAAADAGSLGHANGCTYDPHTDTIYVMKAYASSNSKEIRAFSGTTLESYNSVSIGTAPSGIGYDEPMDQFYFTASSRIYITDGNMDRIRTIYRKRDQRSQDVFGYNGVVMSCIWLGGSASYIDMYRALNGDYLGSIYAPFGEIESACVDDGHLVMLFNGGSIYRTKERIDFPG